MHTALLALVLVDYTINTTIKIVLQYIEILQQNQHLRQTHETELLPLGLVNWSLLGDMLFLSVIGTDLFYFYHSLWTQILVEACPSCLCFYGFTS